MKRHYALLGFVFLLAACNGGGGGESGGLPTGTPTVPAEETFTVNLPAVISGDVDETITLPRGRSVYALLVSGYAVNGDFSELYYYNLAKHLAAQNAYVHFAWWNNLLAPYLERPLHDAASNPGSLPAAVSIDALAQTAAFNPYSSGYGQKGNPTEDVQFQADAKRLLRAIRQHNPDARIIVVGHSMGGGAVARLGADPEISDITIDLLAPIDPVGNRNYPASIPLTSEYNWTRWRATHQPFLGYRQRDCLRGGGLFGNLCRISRLRCPEPSTPGTISGTCCTTVGGWRNAPLIDGYLPTLAPVVCPGVYTHSPGILAFRSNVGYLYHRWQNEFAFPFDWLLNYNFVHPGQTLAQDPHNGTNDQAAVVTCGNPLLTDPQVPAINCHPSDGHGEIVGYRNFEQSDIFHPIPYGTRATGDWPTYLLADSEAVRAEKAARRAELLRDLANWPPYAAGTPLVSHEPQYPQLNMVTADLIRIVDERFGLPPP